VLLRALDVYPEVETVADFQSAIDRLNTGTIKLLVTNLDLQNHADGLHLAYAVADASYATRAIVYAEAAEPWIVRELQRARAFYEPWSRLPLALPSYAQARLPIVDRRNPTKWDRRGGFRGGRRASDGVPMSTARR